MEGYRTVWRFMETYGSLCRLMEAYSGDILNLRKGGMLVFGAYMEAYDLNRLRAQEFFIDLRSLQVPLNELFAI